MSAFSDKLTRLSPDVFFPLGVWWLGTRPEEPLILAFIEGVGLFFPSGGVWWLGTIKTRGSNPWELVSFSFWGFVVARYWSDFIEGVGLFFSLGGNETKIKETQRQISC